MNHDRLIMLGFEFRLLAQLCLEKDANQRKHDDHQECCDEIHDGSRDSFVLHVA